jgi:hypothetical protein
VEGEKMAPQEVRGKFQRKRRNDRPENLCPTAQQEMDETFYDNVNVEHDRRIDIALPVAIKTAGHTEEYRTRL